MTRDEKVERLAEIIRVASPMLDEPEVQAMGLTMVFDGETVVMELWRTPDGRLAHDSYRHRPMTGTPANANTAGGG